MGSDHALRVPRGVDPVPVVRSTFVQVLQPAQGDAAHRLPLLRDRILAWALGHKGASQHVPIPAGTTLREEVAYIDDWGEIHLPHKNSMTKALASLVANGDLLPGSNSRCLMLNPDRYRGGDPRQRRGVGCKRHRTRPGPRPKVAADVC